MSYLYGGKRARNGTYGLGCPGFGGVGVHPSVAVHAAEVDMDLADQVGEPGVADRPL